MDSCSRMAVRRIPGDCCNVEASLTHGSSGKEETMLETCVGGVIGNRE